MIEAADAIVLMKEYPHVDYLERGRELYEICARRGREAVPPGHASLRLPHGRLLSDDQRADGGSWAA